jgi:hypothetical protein
MGLRKTLNDFITSYNSKTKHNNLRLCFCDNLQDTILEDSNGALETLKESLLTMKADSIPEIILIDVDNNLESKNLSSLRISISNIESDQTIQLDLPVKLLN